MGSWPEIRSDYQTVSNRLKFILGMWPLWRAPASSTKWKRQTTSRRIECSFRFSATFSKKMKWKLKTIRSEHNHDAVFIPSGIQPIESHRWTGRRDEKNDKCGCQTDCNFVNAKDDGKKHLRKHAHFVQRKSQSSKQPTRGENSPRNSFWWFSREWLCAPYRRKWRLKHHWPIFAHSDSVKLANRYNHVVVVDCTFRTNRYRVNLLYIIGMTPFNTTLTVGFCFLDGEKVEKNAWAMSKVSTVWKNGSAPQVIVTDREVALMAAIAHVFPSSSNLLCIWHINKKIVANCKKHYTAQKTFDEFLQMWTVLVSSRTAEAYVEQLPKFWDSLSEKSEVFEYVTMTWLVYKEQLVNAWTSWNPRFWK